MKKIIGLLFISAILSLCLVIPGFAKNTTKTGEIVCIGCALKGAYGAKAKCSTYGHRHGLRTKRGNIWTFLENDRSKDLITDHSYAGKQVRIKGKAFPNSQILQVNSFKILEKKGSGGKKKGSGYSKKGS